MHITLIKIIIFIIIFCILWYNFFTVLWGGKDAIDIIYDEPKDSLDIVYIGASNVGMHFNSPLAYHLYGFTNGNYSAGWQPFPITKYLMKETEEYQSPLLYIIDIARVTDNFDDFEETKIRRSIDSMKFSKNRIDVINELLSYNNTDKSQYINYYLSFFIYHNRWKNIEESDFVGHKEFYKGYAFDKSKITKNPQKLDDWSIDAIKLQDTNKTVLIDLINYIKENNKNVLFTIPVRTYSQLEIGRLKDASSIIQENGLNVINFNTLEDFKVDFSTDLWNKGHLNVYGVTKFTQYFSKYLKDHYELPNHKNDEAYKSWEDEYERFKKSYKELTNKDYDELLK